MSRDYLHEWIRRGVERKRPGGIGPNVGWMGGRLALAGIWLVGVGVIFGVIFAVSVGAFVAQEGSLGAGAAVAALLGILPIGVGLAIFLRIRSR